LAMGHMRPGIPLVECERRSSSSEESANHRFPAGRCPSSSSFAAELNATGNRASGVSSATVWQAAQSTPTRSPSPSSSIPSRVEGLPAPGPLMLAGVRAGDPGHLACLHG
jgi:hypothetical protein